MTAEQKACQSCHADFVIGADEAAFIAGMAPVVGGQTLELPLPTRCPRCRQQRRLIWRNERKLYRRTCDKTGDSIVSMYSPDVPFPVYANPVWWSDAWDPFEYGRPVDLNRSIIEQIAELQAVVPHAAASRVDAEDSDFTHNVWNVKGCYLCFNVGYGDDCYYCDECFHNRDLVDSFIAYNSERSYELIHSNKIHSSAYVDACARSSGVFFSYECRASSDLILCTNLHNQRYCIRNVQYTKDEYERRKAELNLGSRTSVRKLLAEFAELRRRATHAPDHNHHIEDSRGDYLIYCKNVVDSFFCYKGENLRYVSKLDEEGKDCQDIDYCAQLERCYESAMVAGYQNLFCVSMYYGQDNLYGFSCRNTRNCFGCVGLRNAEYCIFNTQYTKEEYEMLVPQIVASMRARGEWGEFFPMRMSHLAYNESAAELSYPLDPAAAIALGATWQDRDYTPQYEGEAYVPADDIATYQASEAERTALLAGVIRGEGSGKPFRVTAKELGFYFSLGVPVPTQHPDDRYAARPAQVNPPLLYDRSCRCAGECATHADACSTSFASTYAPDRTERTFCRPCYDEAITHQSLFLRSEAEAQ